MTFGLANAPTNFQAYINHALSDLLGLCAVMYLDDILICPANLAVHERHSAVSILLACRPKGVSLFLPARNQSPSQLKSREVHIMGYTQ